jgi:hypothetical protein
MQPKRKWKGPSAASSSELTSKGEPASSQQLYVSALKTLTRRPFPIRELEQKLLQSCPDAEAVNQVVEVPPRLARVAYLFFTDRERLAREGLPGP